jgi:hypothetical protein
MESNNLAGTQPTQPIPTPPPPKKPTPWALIVIIVLLVETTGIFAYKYFQLKQQLIDQETTLLTNASPTPTSTEIIDPTTNWQTYTHERYNFSFRYPENSLVKNDALDIDGSLEFNNFIFYISKTDDTLIDYVNKMKDTNSPNNMESEENGDLLVREWIGSYKNAPTHYISFLEKGFVYNFGITPLEDISIFNQINTDFLHLLLSTFKFISNDSSKSILSCQGNSDCPEGYFCNTFDNLCYLTRPD